MRAGQHAHVHANGLVRADFLDLATLHDAQDLGLRGQRQVGDLVEEDDAAMGGLEQPPRGSRWRPVNAPPSCPNSSLSISVSGIAEQFTFTNGPRPPLACA